MVCSLFRLQLGQVYRLCPVCIYLRITETPKVLKTFGVFATTQKKLPTHRIHSNPFTTLEAGFSKALQPTFNQQTKTEGRCTTKQIPLNYLNNKL
jgi:hypothetical protein